MWNDLNGLYEPLSTRWAHRYRLIYALSARRTMIQWVHIRIEDCIKFHIDLPPQPEMDEWIDAHNWILSILLTSNTGKFFLRFYLFIPSYLISPVNAPIVHSCCHCCRKQLIAHVKDLTVNRRHHIFFNRCCCRIGSSSSSSSRDTTHWFVSRLCKCDKPMSLNVQ